MIEVIKPGSLVTFKATLGEVAAFVVNVQISATLGVSYLVTWFDGRARNEQWVTAIEVEQTDPKELVQIGFKGAS